MAGLKMYEKCVNNSINMKKHKKLNYQFPSSPVWLLLPGAGFCLQVNGDIPPKLKKSAHEVILDFIRSRPPLNPVSKELCISITYIRTLGLLQWCDNVMPLLTLQASARKLKPQAQAPPTLHERILEEIKAERKLRPVSPDMMRRGRLGELALCNCLSLYHSLSLSMSLSIH